MNWKLISWYVNGIRAAEKKSFLDWLAFYRRLLDVAQRYMQAGRPVVVTGDFNTAYAEKLRLFR